LGGGRGEEVIFLVERVRRKEKTTAQTKKKDKGRKKGRGRKMRKNKRDSTVTITTIHNGIRGKTRKKRGPAMKRKSGPGGRKGGREMGAGFSPPTDGPPNDPRILQL